MTQQKIYEYFDRDPQLHILFIFDAMGLEQSLLEEMTWRDGCRLVIFDGSWFNLKYNLSHDWKDDQVILYFRQLEPNDEESRLKFPLLGELCANKVFSNASYDAYMQQYGIPASYSSFVSRHITEMQSSKIEKMLLPTFSDHTFNPDVAVRAIITSYLGSSVLKEWNDIIMNIVIHDGLDEEKMKNLGYRLSKNPDVFDALNDKLKGIAGRELNRSQRPYLKDFAMAVKYNQIMGNIDTVQADRYKDLRITETAKLDRMARFMEYVNANTRKADFYKAFITLAADIHEDKILACYGANAAYLYLPEAMCWQIIDDNVKNSLTTDPDAVIERMDRIIVSNEGNEDIRKVTDFIVQTAKYYSLADKLQRQMVLNTPEDYIRTYVKDGYQIDTFYRLAMEYFYTIDAENVSDTIRDAKTLLDKKYAEYTNSLNQQWIDRLNHSGKNINDITDFSHQAHFYADYIEHSSNKQAVIVCDALRYEVAQELVEELYKKQHQPELGCAIAMLPTETAYCKPSLLPHRTLSISGTRMLVDGYALDTKQSREDHLKRYKAKSKCVSFTDVARRNGREVNRELFKNDLVYIFHNDIDGNGHDDNAQSAVNACRSSIKEIAKTVHSIMSTYNVHDVLITADHGFLLNDMAFEDKDKQPMTEEGFEKKSRYYLTDSGDQVGLFNKYPISVVSDIESPAYVSVPVGTNRVAAPGGYKFAHGGASLQELIIPVIRCKLRRGNVDDLPTVGAKIMDCTGRIESSTLLFSVLQTETVSNDFKKRTVQCAIFENNKMVSRECSVELSSTDPDPNHRTFPVRLTLNGSTSSGLLELRVWDKADEFNPLDTKKLTNNTLIERDDF